jgi:hypothetical protein
MDVPDGDGLPFHQHLDLRHEPSKAFRQAENFHMKRELSQPLDQLTGPEVELLLEGMV